MLRSARGVKCISGINQGSSSRLRGWAVSLCRRGVSSAPINHLRSSHPIPSQQRSAQAGQRRDRGS